MYKVLPGSTTYSTADLQYIKIHQPAFKYSQDIFIELSHISWILKFMTTWPEFETSPLQITQSLKFAWGWHLVATGRSHRSFSIVDIWVWNFDSVLRSTGHWFFACFTWFQLLQKASSVCLAPHWLFLPLLPSAPLTSSCFPATLPPSENTIFIAALSLNHARWFYSNDSYFHLSFCYLQNN